ncbi:MAG: lycopene cyclase domain-containing protein [Candidatus Villigracilaceae bacterium]
MKPSITPELGRAALRALFKERSLLGPLKVMAKHVGRFFQIPLPGFRPYVVFGPEANRKVLITEREKLLWRNTDPVTDLLRRGVLIVDGEEHDRYRSLMEPSLHPSALPGYTDKMLYHTDRVTAQWRDGDIVDMLVESRKIALLIIMQTLFSKDVWDDLPRLWHPILKAIEFISPGVWIFWRKMPRPGFRKSLRELDEYLFGIIAGRRGRTASTHVNTYTGTHRPDTSPLAPDTRPPSDLLQHLIDAGLTDDLIRDQMLTMLIAGHDTSTALLAWTFALLGQNPDIFQRLIAELDAHEKPPLLDQVIKESLRLYPPIHIGNRRVAEEIHFDEGSVPAGERMFYSIYLTHRDLSAAAWWDNKRGILTRGFANGRAVWINIGVHVLLAVVYTTPWDNYLVATGVWYYNRNLVTGIVIGYVPIEEYTFFVLETILSGLWWWFLARRISPPKEFKPNKRLVYVSTCVLVLLWFLFTALFFSDNAPLTYLSITLFWAFPAIFPQLLFGADILWHHRKLVALALFIPAAYLSLMDIAALTEATWSISKDQTTGILFFGILPLEEVVFFFITNTLIVFGMTLMLSQEGPARFARGNRAAGRSCPDF